jgi:hypothetical protein
MNYTITLLICFVLLVQSVFASESPFFTHLNNLTESERAAYLDQLKRENEAASLHESGITLDHLAIARKAALTPDLCHIKNIKGPSDECSLYTDDAGYRGEFSAIPRASLIAERTNGRINARICIPHGAGVKEIPVNHDYFELMAKNVATKNITPAVDPAD